MSNKMIHWLSFLFVLFSPMALLAQGLCSVYPVDGSQYHDLNARFIFKSCDAFPNDIRQDAFQLFSESHDAYPVSFRMNENQTIISGGPLAPLPGDTPFYILFQSDTITRFRTGKAHHRVFPQEAIYKSDTIPDDFPDIKVATFGETSSGHYYITDAVGPYPYFIIAQDEEVLHYSEDEPNLTNFQYLGDNRYGVFNVDDDVWYQLDTNFIPIDTAQCIPPLKTDFHDAVITPEGNTLLINYNNQVVDMSVIVPGGQPNALIQGAVLQEISPSGLLVWEWRSWDHFEITDGWYAGYPAIDFTANSISYVHVNSLEIDDDGQVIMSSRHMSEVTKINRNTGEITWRLGGKNNEFTFINDPLNGFWDQHDARRISNGLLTIFDNGLHHSPPQTRGVAYQLDEVNKTATLVWEYYNPENHVTTVTGNLQELEDDHFLLAWGRRAVSPVPTLVATEIDENRQAVQEVRWINPGNTLVYRAYKMPWHRDLLSTSVSEIETSPEIQVFPNPASETVRLQRSDSKAGIWSVFNGMGQLIHQQSIRESEQEKDINCSDWPAGIYQVIWQTKDSRSSAKLLIF